MNKKLLRTMSVAFLAAALPLFTACSSMETAGQNMEPGAVAVATTRLTATVKAVNHRDRTVTLLGPNGKRVTYKVSEAAVNFDQIRVGDRVSVTVTEALAVYLAKGRPLRWRRRARCPAAWWPRRRKSRPAWYPSTPRPGM
jgi:hypothetical protein